MKVVVMFVAYFDDFIAGSLDFSVALLSVM